MRTMLRTMLIILLCPFCLSFSPTLTNFNGGQVSPLLESRVDFQKYNISCRTLENMLVTVHGPVERRPGTKFISDVFSSDQYGYGFYGEGIYGE